MTRLAERFGYAADALLAVGLAVVAVLTLLSASVPEGGRQPDALAYILALALTLPLAIRRVSPIGVLAIMILGSLGYGARGYPSVSIDFFGPVIAYYTVASQEPRPTAISAGMILWLGVIASTVLSPTEADKGATVLTSGVVVLAVWLFGQAVRQRREYAERLEVQTIQLEAARQELAEQAVVQERLRIARDLHDVVAHHMSTIVVQSAVARDAVGKDEPATIEAIEHVQSVSRSALGEIRQLLGILRRSGNGESAPPSQPGLSDLGDLLAEARAGGIYVEVTATGQVLPLSAAVDLTAYRLIQEALTNVMKHAVGSNASITVQYAPEALTIEVVNDSASGSTAASRLDGGSGLGIPGMRERVALLGGSFAAGPRAEGGFRVSAVLPLSTKP
jgi:signal transduction histidine kinase